MTEDDIAKLNADGFNVVPITPELGRLLDPDKVDDIAPPDLIGTVRFAASFTAHAVNIQPIHLVQDVLAGSVMRIGSKLRPGRVTLQIAGRAGRDAERIDLTPAELALLVGVGQRLLAEIAK